jgi:hypothetical protein
MNMRRAQNILSTDTNIQIDSLQFTFGGKVLTAKSNRLMTPKKQIDAASFSVTFYLSLSLSYIHTFSGRVFELSHVHISRLYFPAATFCGRNRLSL